MPDVGRALVLAEGASRGALAAVRALGRAGWEVGVAGPGPTTAGRSRWCARTHTVPSWDAVDRLGYDVVLASTDSALPPELVDKVVLGEAAARVGLRTPGEAGDPPAVVKVRSHHARRIEATVARTRAELDAAIEAVRAAGGEPLVQPFVKGQLVAVVVVLGPDGRRLGWQQQRAEAVWPEPAGVSCRAVTERADPDLVERVVALAREVGCTTGVAQAQFLDTADDGLCLLDLNCRLYGSLALAVAAGLPVPTMLAGLGTGRPVPPVGEARAGVRYRWLEGDARRAVRTRSVRPLLGGRADVGAVWDRHDPVPAWAEAAGLAGRVLRKGRR